MIELEVAIGRAESWRDEDSHNGDQEVGIVLLAEVKRLRQLFDDAGQGEQAVLALVDHYQAEAMKADEEVTRLRDKLARACSREEGA